MVGLLRPFFIALFIVFGCIFAVALGNQKASAATGNYSLTTSPISLNVATKPGTTTTKTLQLMNNSTQPVQIAVQLDQFGPEGTTGQAQITTIPSNNSSASWVHFSPSTFTAQPGVWENVQMTLKLPVTASLGYYYAVLFQPVVPNPTITHFTNIIKGSNAVLVLVDTQSANESRQVQIADFSVTKHLYEYLPATFKVNIRNSGNIYLIASGNIFISKNSNLTNAIGTLTINSGGGNILPDSDRIFTANWNSGFPNFQDKKVDGKVINDSKGNPVEQLDWNFANLNKFRIGEYYAQLTLVYNNGTRVVPLTGVVSFWVIPWKLLLGLLVIVVLLGLGFWSAGRAIIRRIRKVRIRKK